MRGIDRLGAGELMISVQRGSSIPLHRQLAEGIRQAIRSGRIRQGGVLPPSRALAEDLGVSRGVVVEAYQQLTAEGYLASRAGGYTEVTALASPTRHAEPTAAHGPAVTADFRYGRPDVSQFPRVAWLRSLRRVLTEIPHERLNYPDGRGAVELRQALADYLTRVRGTSATPEDVVLCNGFGQGIALIIQVLAAAGIRRLAVEDPSDPDSRRVAAAYGLDVVSIPVTSEGLDIDTLAASDAQAVLVTPAHQFPTGAVLTAHPRSRLLDWARRHNAIVIEDDYDAEYRFDHAPVGALQGLAPDLVIYAGSASKTLAPGRRLGWLLVPPSFTEQVATAKIDMDRGSPVIDQLAFADFLVHGEFDRHLRRMRPLYRQRRDALITALAEHLPTLTPAGASAGLHLITWLPPDLPEEDVVTAALARGVHIGGLGGYRATAGPAALLFGYGKLSPPAIHDSVRLLADVIKRLRSTRRPSDAASAKT